MTFIMTLVLVIALVIGIAVLARALRGSGRRREDLSLGTQTACPHCQLLNPTHAKFCGHCGKALQ
jgi:hypothetical protein